MIDCEDPQSGEVKNSDGAMVMRWVNADCGRCPPCSKRRAARLWTELSEAKSEVVRLQGELALLGVNT